MRHSLRQEPFGYSLGLQRSARLPILASLYNELQRPFLLLTDRADHALTLLDELSLWLPSASLLLFPEPTPLFYENAPWGETTRRDRLKALTTLAAYNIPGGQTYLDPSTTNPIIIAPASSSLNPSSLPVAMQFFLKRSISFFPFASFSILSLRKNISISFWK